MTPLNGRLMKAAWFTGRTLAAGLLAALLVAGPGCVSSDLSKNAETNASVLECLPPGTPAPLVVVRAFWFPKARGFGSTDASELGHAAGALALAGDRLWFMAWNHEEHHFDMLHDIDVASTQDISVVHLGSSTMLVVESHNQSFDSFELMNGGQFGTDPAATQALFASLQQIRSRHPQGDF